MNRIFFTGNLGADAEEKYTPKGDAVVTFPVAVSVGYGENKQTMWMSVSYWGKRAQGALPYLTKGKQVAVSGEMSQNTHKDKTYNNVQAEVVELLGSKGVKKEEGGFRDKPAEKKHEYKDDDIPF